MELSKLSISSWVCFDKWYFPRIFSFHFYHPHISKYYQHSFVSDFLFSWWLDCHVPVLYIQSAVVNVTPVAFPGQGSASAVLLVAAVHGVTGVECDWPHSSTTTNAECGIKDHGLNSDIPNFALPLPLLTWAIGKLPTFSEPFLPP